MSKVEAILSQLKEVAANPKKAMDDYKAETGKGAVGIMLSTLPKKWYTQQVTCLWVSGAHRANRFPKHVHICPHSLVPSCSRSWNCSAKALTMIWQQFCSLYLVIH